ncbi:MAG: hypothetical protein AAGB05_03195 [Pseudomonadota bacterium]
MSRRSPTDHTLPSEAPSGATSAAWTIVPSTAALRIEMTRAPEPARTAPEAVWFEAIPEGFTLEPKPQEAFAYRPAFHQIEYTWDFGEPDARFTAPQNVPDAYRDANRATGQITAHVFQTGGTKRVRCVARRVVDGEAGEIEEAVAEVTLDIGDPETLWTELNTVVVALDGDFTGAPPGARATTIANTEEAPWWSTPRHWLTQVNRLIGEGERKIRVLFKRGEFYATHLYKPNTRAPHIVPFMLFGAWGDPARPRPAFMRLGSRQNGWSNTQSFVFQSVRALHEYNSIAERGPRETLMSHNEGGYALFDDVGFQNAGTAVVVQTKLFGPEGMPTRLCFHDCHFEGLAEYGLFSEERPDDRVAYLGCRDIDVGSAPHGGHKNFRVGNSQGPLRVEAKGEWIILGCDFFCRFGWNVNGTWPGTDVPLTVEQPCIRVFSAGDTRREGNGRVVVARCTGEGGGFLSAGTPPRLTAPRGNLLVEQVIHVASPSATSFMGTESGAVTIRNSHWIKPEVPGSKGMASLLAFPVVDRPADVPDDRVAHLSEPIHIYNNTFVVLDPNPLRFGTFAGIDRYVAYDDANNVLYMPLAEGEPRHEEIAPIETEVLWEARWLGRLELADNGILQAQYAPPRGSVRLYWPVAGSPLIGTARGTVSVVDLLGRERDGTQARGALNPR